MLRSLPFGKYEGTGNHFVVFDARHFPRWTAIVKAIDPQRAQPTQSVEHESHEQHKQRDSEAMRRWYMDLCRVHTGVGADGVITLLPPDDDKHLFRMHIVNADGSVPEMCGNGLRCAALSIKHNDGIQRKTQYWVNTDAGTRGIVIDDAPENADSDEKNLKTHTEQNTERYTDKPEPDFDLAWVTLDMGRRRVENIESVEEAGRAFVGRFVDVGNPHFVMFIDDEKNAYDMARQIGPALEVNRRFPERANIEFCVQKSPTDVVMHVWERGVGITFACGTGACAVAAAAVAAGASPTEIPIGVELPGGTLFVTIPADMQKPILMRGPVRLVYLGVVAIPEKLRDSLQCNITGFSSVK